jgi:hypothetical protein
LFDSQSVNAGEYWQGVKGKHVDFHKRLWQTRQGFIATLWAKLKEQRLL